MNTCSKSNTNWHARAKFENISWSHIRELLRFRDEKIINYYLNEIENKKLTIEELLFIIKSKSFERTISNQRKDKTKNKIDQNLKDPIILNIDNKKRNKRYSS